MNSLQLREEFLNFFKEKGHKIIPSSSLIPEDTTVLLTTAGMQQFVQYLSGEKDVLSIFNSRHLTSVQKCFRTPDIEEVGDDTHHTFFEMLGNWSIGEDIEKGYFKRGAIDFAFEFFIERLNLDKDKIWITVFKGENEIPKDNEAIMIWQEKGIPKERILELASKDNFWGPTSKTGPCGPSSEIHYDRGIEYGCGNNSCKIGCNNCRRFVELWNLVFMEYNKDEDGSFSKLPSRNVDTGIGFERLVSVLQKKDSAYETDLFLPVIKKIEEISLKKYENNKEPFRIIADHIRGSVFLIADGVLPSNTERGYILRRILRRMIRYGYLFNFKKEDFIFLTKNIINLYGNFYPELKKDEKEIILTIEKEEEKFGKTLEKGIEELRKIIEWFDKENLKQVLEVNLDKGKLKKGKNYVRNAKELGKKLFYIYQSYGFPIEMSLEEFIKFFKVEIIFIEEVKRFFEEEFRKHQEISKAGAEKKFGGVGDRESIEAVKFHTTTHLLHRALRDVLGNSVKQMGSDITKERLRFDFSYDKKLTEEEIKKIENIINKKIEEGLDVKKEEMSYNEAIDFGALAFFKERYPERVSVYSIGNYSKEICGGPHVKNTFEIGKIKIKKEESVGVGVRRIRIVFSSF